ncbi:MAG: RRXRR domain-containing protein, partial [Synergistaceae bacterium]|nr:RRXRR domain-containing protein [Synergistaceae bacterium]
MLVYVLNKNEKTLMPCKAVKARILLKQGKAKVIRKEPFTIQILYGSSGYKQYITLGVDAGAKHIGLSANTNKILSVTKIIVETASFDIQKIKNSGIQNAEYQQGEQLGFWNVREYVLFRDNHTCQHCQGKRGDKALNVHHIESRKTGGNPPNNLITLCETCHSAYHAGKIKLKQVRKHNRQIHKTNFIKGGIRKRNQTPYMIFGFRLFDKVKYKGQTCFIYGRRASGSFYLKKLDRTIVSGGVTYKNLRLIAKRKTFIT